MPRAVAGTLARLEQLRILQVLGGRVLTMHQALYERSDGRVGHRILGVPCLLLRTVGARSGRTRVSALAYGRDGEDYLVAASMGGSPRAPGWYHNVRAHPEIEIQVGRRRLRVVGRVVHAGASEYERLWDLVNAGNHDRYRGYQRLTTRPIPVVVLSPQDAE